MLARVDSCERFLSCTKEKDNVTVFVPTLTAIHNYGANPCSCPDRFRRVFVYNGRLTKNTPTLGHVVAMDKGASSLTLVKRHKHIESA